MMKKLLSLLFAVTLLFALATSALSAEFTPSVESKEAPEVVEQTDEEGNTYAALIFDDTGYEEGVPLFGVDEPVAGEDVVELVVTAISRADNAPTPEIKHLLDQASQQVKAVPNVTYLVPEVGEKLAEYIEAHPEMQGTAADDIRVIDLFDVSLLQNLEIIPVPGGCKVKFTVNTVLRPGDFFSILHNIRDDEWEYLDDVKLSENGDLTVIMDSLSVIAIVTIPAPGKPEGGPTSPFTGDTHSPMLLILPALVCAAGSVAFLVKARKSRP